MRNRSRVIFVVICLWGVGWSQSHLGLASTFCSNAVSGAQQQRAEKSWTREEMARVKEMLSRLDDHELIKIVSDPQGDLMDRLQAVHLLGERKSRVAVPTLIHLLESKELILSTRARLSLVTPSMYALARIGDQQAGPVLMAVARRDPLFTHSAVLALGELGYEPAMPLLMEFVRSASDPLVQSMAAAVLKNDFGQDDGVEMLWPLLLSDDEKEFELAWNVVIRIHEKYRDTAFLDKLVKAMMAQMDPSRLVGLMLGLINADDGYQQAARFLYSLLDDEREARQYFSQGREASVGDFAAYYLAHLLRGKMALPSVAGNILKSSPEDRRKFREAVKREATKILFGQ